LLLNNDLSSVVGGSAMTRRELLALLPASPFAVCSSPAFTQQDTRLTLQHALNEAAPPTVVTVTIGPQWEKLPQGKTAPRSGASVQTIAQSFDKMVRRFGTVAAVTFPTMTILNTAPGEPNPYIGMPFSDLLPLCAASLSEGEFKALASSEGLAVGSLSGDAKNMALQIFGGGKFMVEKWRPTQFGQTQPTTDISNRINQTRLRFKQFMHVMLPAESGGHYGSPDYPPSHANALRLMPRKDWGGSQDTLYGQTVRATVPNAPKRSQLKIRQESLLQSVSFNDLTTVRQVIERIRAKSGIELYADGRWLHKTVQIIAPPQTSFVVAADLLQALAFCLSATFRQVGPAYVMTDDIIGYGTRRLIWHEFELYADALRAKPAELARNKVWERNKSSKISGHDDPATLSEEQQRDEWRYQNGQSGRLLSDFTPAQQAVIHKLVDTHNAEYKQAKVNEGGKYVAEPGVMLQLLVPGMEQPVETGIQFQQTMVMTESDEEQAARQKAEGEARLTKMFAEEPETLIDMFQQDPETWQAFVRDSPELAKTFAAKYPVLNTVRAKSVTLTFAITQLVGAWAEVPHRGVFVYPLTPSDIASEFEAAKRIGANEVWLRVDTSEAGEATLTSACEQAKAWGLDLCVLMGVLGAGKTADKSQYDLTLLGETSEQAKARVLKRHDLTGSGVYAPDPERTYRLPATNALCPRKKAVQESLQKTVRSLCAREAVKQIVFSDICPPGYTEAEPYRNGVSVALGYEGEMRLAFLRLHSTDPIDLFNGYPGKANTKLVNYQYDESVTDDLMGKWREFRQRTVQELLASLHKEAGRIPVWVEAGSQLSWDKEGQTVSKSYLPWTDPKKPLPTVEPGRENFNLTLGMFMYQALHGFKATAKDTPRLLLETHGKPLATQIPSA
jgi:hypothetical protein